MRLIDADAFKIYLEEIRQEMLGENTKSSDIMAEVIETVQDEYLQNAPTVDAVVLPCKPGDTVFVLWRLADPDICSKCPDFHWGGMGDSHECGKTEDGFRSAECVEIQEWTANRDRILDWIRFDEFGRTVFPTREEAEAALDKRRNEHET